MVKKMVKKEEVGNGFGIVGLILALLGWTELIFILFTNYPFIRSLSPSLLILPLIGIVLCIIQGTRKSNISSTWGFILSIILLFLLFWYFLASRFV